MTINPEMTSTKMTIGECSFDAPMMASAMDGTVSPRFAALMHEMGGLGVLNGEGLYSRYDDPYSILEEIYLYAPGGGYPIPATGLFRADSGKN